MAKHMATLEHQRRMEASKQALDLHKHNDQIKITREKPQPKPKGE
jgi:hypothetical protein